MDNAYHALIMGGAVLLFLIALSVGIYQYNKVIDATKSILTTSEYYDRTAEIYKEEDYGKNYSREYTGAEIAFQIISMYQNKDYSYKRIIVNDVGTFNAPTDGSKGGDKYISQTGINDSLRAIASTTHTYRIISIDFENGIVRYQ